MGVRRLFLAGAVSGLLFVVAGCGGTVNNAECDEGERRCVGDRTVEVCDNWTWRTETECPAEEACVAGYCTGDCTPSCTGRECGDDGCGGSCGECTAPETCGATGVCGTAPPGCGDGECAAGETCVSCPADCVCPGECESADPVDLAACVDRARYLADLELVAGERDQGSAHWLEVQNHCATVLGDLGFAVTRQGYGTAGVNVVGVLTGTGRPDEQVVIGAHYDHIAGCEGADDNASGVAGALEAARVLAPVEFARTLVVVCLDEEEDGLLGSFAYARAANQRGDQLVAFEGLEMIGYADHTDGSQEFPEDLAAQFPEVAAEVEANGSRGDFILLVHDDRARGPATRLEHHLDVTAGLSAIRLELVGDERFAYADLLRSDHASFWAYAYPAAMLGDTAEFRNPNYHCSGGDDTVDTLDVDFATDVVRGLVAAAAEALADDTPPPARPPATTCAALCGSIATTEQLDCVIEVLGRAGLDVGSVSSCETAATQADCTTCATDLGLLDGDCSLLAYYCL